MNGGGGRSWERRNGGRWDRGRGFGVEIWSGVQLVGLLRRFGCGKGQVDGDRGVWDEIESYKEIVGLYETSLKKNYNS